MSGPRKTAVAPQASRTQKAAALAVVSMPRFLAYLQKSRGQLPVLLPLVHITEWQYARAILEEKMISARRCEHFSAHLSREEKLIYCFYGRPAYRPKAQMPSLQIAKAPIAFLFQIDVSKYMPCRLYPFDTGAFFNKLYINHFDEAWCSPDPFLMGANPDNARKLVRAFYGTNDSYIGGNVKKKKDIDYANFEVDAYMKMISDAGVGVCDNRASTVEVQFDKPLHLKEMSLKKIVVPESLLRIGGEAKNLVESFAGKNGCIAYPLSRGSTTDWYGGMSNSAIQALNQLV